MWYREDGICGALGLSDQDFSEDSDMAWQARLAEGEEREGKRLWGSMRRSETGKRVINTQGLIECLRCLILGRTENEVLGTCAETPAAPAVICLVDTTTS